VVNDTTRQCSSRDRGFTKNENDATGWQLATRQCALNIGEVAKQPVYINVCPVSINSNKKTKHRKVFVNFLQNAFF